MKNELSHLRANQVRPYIMGKDSVKNYQALAKLGICLDEKDIMDMHAKGYGFDAALTAPLTTASVTTPIQFLQAWLPGFVAIITAARRIDALIGITTQGRWEDEEIVQGIMEHTGNSVPYGDLTNVPQASWNTNFETRTIIRFEEGLTVGRLEEARAAAMRASSPEEKRKAAGTALEIVRNLIGFYGYNSGANKTYGLLNDPSLPAYADVIAGTGGTEWMYKTFLEITADIREMISALRVQSQDRIDPSKTPLVLALAMSARDFMSVTSDFGNSVAQWLQETYPNVRVESVPEFDGANGGDNVMYLFAEQVDDESTDDSRTFVQVVPAKFQTLGVEQKSKSYMEDYTNATAGTLLKRPFAVIRRSAI
jgi:hypothetical protein